MHTDPTPLDQESSTPAALRSALQDASSRGAPSDLMAALLRQAQLPPPPPPPPPTAAWVPWLKWVVPLASVGLLGAGLLLRRPATIASGPRDVASVVAFAPTASASEQPAASAPPASSEATAPDPLPTASSAAAVAAPGGSAARPTRAPDEAALLEQARASLATNPARTLALTREHARRFPRGLLVQEREVLAVEALRRVGKPGEASSRGDLFRAENPDSAYVPRVTPGRPRP